MQEQYKDPIDEESARITGINIGIRVPEPRSVLRIAPHEESWHGKKLEVMRIESPYPYPGALRRLLYWILLGWKWERSKSDD